MTARTPRNRTVPHALSRRSLLAAALAGAGAAALSGCDDAAQKGAALTATNLTEKIRRELDTSSKENIIDYLAGDEELASASGFATGLF